LRRQGQRLVGRCPFHEDRSPSLNLYPETQSFHCFGCGAGGDVIDFVRRAEGVGFREALERLGDVPSNGSAPARHEPSPPPRRPPRLSLDDRLTLTAACELYHEELLRTPEAVLYLERRGISVAVARRFRLGYSDGRSL